MDDSSAAIYSEAKSEYTKQLVFNFQPVLLRFFLDRFNEVKTSSSVAMKTKSSLSEFQDSLSQIPEWNLDKVNSESTVLLKSMQCDYTEDLITAVFIAHTKILSAIRLHSKPRRKINITVPKPEHFMHRAISECSRLLWSNVYLFNDSASSIDKQKNMNEVNRFIEEGILQAIRNLLPVKSILRDSLQEDDDMIQVNMKDAEDKDEYEIKEPEPKESEAKEPEPKEPEPKESEPKESEPKESEQVVSEVKDPDIKELVDIKEVPNTVNVVKEPETLIIDTERSVGFTGIDSIFGTTGEAELKPMIEEGDDELKIIGDLEELNFEEIEDLDKPDSMSAPLAIGDYETL